MNKYTINGNDLLSAVPTSIKETNYVDELTTSSNSTTTNSSGFDPNKAQDKLRQEANFSNFFIQVGFKITFGE